MIRRSVRPTGLLSIALGATLVFAAAASLDAADASPDNAPIATTTAGRVRGTVDNGIHAFKAIPYGADTAKRRFQAPLPPEPWSDVRDATKFGPIAPQPISRRGLTQTPEGAGVSEDCLRLNVWTPALRDERKRPVVVYFHGGAYNGGSVNEDFYDGARLSRRAMWSSSR